MVPEDGWPEAPLAGDTAGAEVVGVIDVGELDLADEDLLAADLDEVLEHEEAAPAELRLVPADEDQAAPEDLDAVVLEGEGRGVLRLLAVGALAAVLGASVVAVVRLAGGETPPFTAGLEPAVTAAVAVPPAAARVQQLVDEQQLRERGRREQAREQQLRVLSERRQRAAKRRARARAVAAMPARPAVSAPAAVAAAPSVAPVRSAPRQPASSAAALEFTP